MEVLTDIYKQWEEHIGAIEQLKSEKIKLNEDHNRTHLQLSQRSLVKNTVGLAGVLLTPFSYRASLFTTWSLTMISVYCLFCRKRVLELQQFIHLCKGTDEATEKKNGKDYCESSNSIGWNMPELKYISPSTKSTIDAILLAASTLKIATDGASTAAKSTTTSQIRKFLISLSVLSIGYDLLSTYKYSNDPNKKSLNPQTDAYCREIYPLEKKMKEYKDGIYAICGKYGQDLVYDLLRIIDETRERLESN